jgi:plasmid maintenance system antidote protein VapI
VVDLLDIQLFDMSVRSVAEKSGIAVSRLARVVAEFSPVSPEMACDRHRDVTGRSPESGLAVRNN